MPSCQCVCTFYVCVAPMCFYHLRRIRAIRGQLGRDITARLVTALVLLRLDYCNAMLAGLSRFLDTAIVHLGLTDTSRRHTRMICTACLVMWQPRHATDVSTNQQQSFLCCRTTCMEQAADRPEAAAVNRLILQKTENVFESVFGHQGTCWFVLWCASVY